MLDSEKLINLAKVLPDALRGLKLEGKTSVGATTFVWSTVVENYSFATSDKCCIALEISDEEGKPQSKIGIALLSCKHRGGWTDSYVRVLDPEQLSEAESRLSPIEYLPDPGT